MTNLLKDLYPHPFLLSPLDNGTSPSGTDPGVSPISPGTLSGLALSGLLNGVGCVPSQAPANLDPNFLRDVRTQLLV